MDVDALAEGEWISDGEETWAGDEAPQPLTKIRPVATAAAAAIEIMEREDGEFMPSPTNPIP
ncbi:MAG: hypothetical protein WA700_00970 [Acidobacteriaceae bacterium]